MDWTPFYVTAAVLVTAFYLVPRGFELARLYLRFYIVRRWMAREDHALSAPHHVSGVQRAARPRALHGLSARDRRMDNDAA